MIFIQYLSNELKLRKPKNTEVTTSIVSSWERRGGACALTLTFYVCAGTTREVRTFLSLKEPCHQALWDSHRARGGVCRISITWACQSDDSGFVALLTGLVHPEYGNWRQFHFSCCHRLSLLLTLKPSNSGPVLFESKTLVIRLSCF